MTITTDIVVTANRTEDDDVDAESIALLADRGGLEQADTVDIHVCEKIGHPRAVDDPAGMPGGNDLP